MKKKIKNKIYKTENIIQKPTQQCIQFAQTKQIFSCEKKCLKHAKRNKRKQYLFRENVKSTPSANNNFW